MATRECPELSTSGGDSSQYGAFEKAPLLSSCARTSGYSTGHSGKTMNGLAKRNVARVRLAKRIVLMGTLCFENQGSVLGSQDSQPKGGLFINCSFKLS